MKEYALLLLSRICESLNKKKTKEYNVFEKKIIPERFY